MKYRPELGIFGNIKIVISELTKTNNDFANEIYSRQAADTGNREAVEQSLTDLYLDGIQAQQDITDIQLQLLEETK